MLLLLGGEGVAGRGGGPIFFVNTIIFTFPNTTPLARWK